MTMTGIIGGLISIVLGAFGLIFWWAEFGLVLRGFIPFALIIFGLLSIAAKYQNKKNGESKK
jgi:hypothetical protein